MIQIIPVLPLFAVEVGASERIVGYVVAAKGVGGMVLAPLGGAIVALLGVRRGAALGVSSMGIGATVAALTPSWQMLLGSRVLDGLGLALFQVGRYDLQSQTQKSTPQLLPMCR